jgi:hypothetical protein
MMTMTPRVIAMAAALATGLALAAAPAQAAPSAIDLFTEPQDTFVGATLTIGWLFSVDRDIAVTALGVFDDFEDGLFFAAPVGIWDMQGQLLTSAVVPKDQLGALQDGFRYTSIAPFHLKSGEHYVIGAFYAGDFAATLGPGEGAFNPHVHFEGNRFANTNAFLFPGMPDEEAPFAGPNFQATGIPEPASWALMIAGFGLAGVALRGRRRLPGGGLRRSGPVQ